MSTHLAAVAELRHRLLASDLRLRGAEVDHSVAERPAELVVDLRSARNLLDAAESQRYLSASDRDIVEGTLARLERSIIELSPTGRPSLRAVEDEK